MRKPYLLMLFAPFLVQCAHARLDPPTLPYPVDSPCTSEAADLNVVTFNAAVAPGMNHWSTPRRPHVADALKSTEYDVLCLQEVWPYDAAEEVAAALGQPVSHMAYADTRGMHQTGEDSCSANALDGLISCARQECAGVQDEDIALCAVDKCSGKLLSLYLFNRPCFNCMAASVGNSIDGTVSMCTAPGGASRIYGGTNGIMLVSKWPIENPEAVDLPSTGANKVALFGRIRPPGKPPIEVACTHISSPQRVAPTYPGFKDWDDEQREQLTIISDRLAERAGDSPQLLIGDLNISWHYLEGGRGQSADVYRDSELMGFVSPAAYVRPEICSACRGNSFRGERSTSHLIDHVMMRDPPGGAETRPFCAERLFTEQVDVTAYGETRRMHISDHYGIRVKFRIR